jgi:glycosyltransferase involved in cell wall biosynthesis
MYILHITSSYYPAVLDGGPIKSVHGLCKSLVKLGNYVLVITTNIEGRDTVMDVPLCREVEIDGVQVIYFPSYIFKRFAYSKEMREYLNENISRFDMVHIHGAYQLPSYFASRASVKFSIPYIFTPRGMLMRDAIVKKNSFLKKIWISIIEKRNVKDAYKVHATSSLESSDIVDQFKIDYDNIINIPNGVEIPNNLFVQKNKEFSFDVPYVLFLGRINWKKGLDRLLRSWVEINDYQLIIAGNDEDGYMKELERMVLELQLSKTVSLIGHVDAGKWDLYKKADLFILPSYSENFGNVILEAMAMSCPILTTVETGASDIVKKFNCGVVLNKGGANLTEAIKAALSNKENLELMGVNGKVATEKFGWDTIAREIIKVYRGSQ